MSTDSGAQRLACPHCGLTVRYAAITPTQIARCRRCDAVLWRGQHLGVDGLLAFAIASSIAFLVAQGTALVSVSLRGAPRNVDWPSSVGLSWMRGEHLVSMLALATALVVPAAVICLRLYVLIGLALGRVPRGFAPCLRWLHALSHWNMVEVLTIGALVSIVRMAGLATIAVEPALLAFAALALLLAAQEAAGQLPLWQMAEARLRTPRPTRGEADRATSPRAGAATSPGAASATSPGAGAATSLSSRPETDTGPWLGCPTCHLASHPADAARAASAHRGLRIGGLRLTGQAALRCPRCGHALHVPEAMSVQRTWALLVASAACYVPANLLPIMQTTSALRSESHTILGGIVELWTGGTQMLAVIVFVASILVPVIKIVVLAGLAWSVRSAPGWRRLQRARFYRVVDAVGHWSMLDVYVVVLLTALVRFGQLAAVRPGPGLLPFAAVVVLTVLAAQAFDPRLIWQDRGARVSPARLPTRLPARQPPDTAAAPVQFPHV